MPNAPEPDRGGTPDEGATEEYPLVPSDAETETVVISRNEPHDGAAANLEDPQLERRFTAPGFDAKETTIIATAPEPATEVFAPVPGPGGPQPQMGGPPKTAAPQSIRPREEGRLRSAKQSKWGWVLAIVVIVLAVTAIAILLTVLLTRSKNAKVSEEDRVRRTIQNFDAAVQRGDLTALRGMTCGASRDGYVDYDEHAWQETYERVSAAKQYPVIANIDQVVVNGQHAEANVTTFMANDPQVRSTRSLDLQFRDDQWKICQSSSG
jgi:type II secretory pathway pseudopilin PulG